MTLESNVILLEQTTSARRLSCLRGTGHWRGMTSWPQEVSHRHSESLMKFFQITHFQTSIKPPLLPMSAPNNRIT